MKLAIEFLSPVCIGSGIGRPGIVDRESIFDPETGLPQIPARRLKGLLLDAYRQIAGTGALTGCALPEDPSLVFGETGAERGGCLRLGDAGLDAGLRSEMAALVSSRDSPIARAEVLEQFAEVRRQTAVDRESGVADDETLRFTRVLRAGLVLRAPVSGLGAPAARDTIALAAAGVKRLGTARSRGWGEVKLWLEGENGEDLTAALLIALRGQQPWPASPDPNGAAPVPSVGVVAAAAPHFTHRMAYAVTLRSPALLPVTQQADPNTAASDEVLPGPSIRGILAHRYIGRSGVDGRFQELFCTGQVAVLPASPVAWIEGSMSATLPAPHSIREDKGETAAPWDMAMGDPREDFEPKRLKGRSRFAPAKWEQRVASPKVQVQTNLHYHHQRAHDARVQRALGSEQEDLSAYPGLRTGQQGALFVYESISPGQTFRGEILGSADDLAEIRKLIGHGETVHAGRSKSAQYGGQGEWQWCEGIEPFAPEAEAENNRWIVHLLTPLIAVNQNGHPAAEFPKTELHPQAKIEKAFTRREFQGGFLSHQRLPRQQMPALAAGSTFVIALPAGADPVAASRRSYGFRTEEGFGRIAIGPVMLPEGDLFDKKPDKAVARRLASPAARKLAVEILKRQIQRKTRVGARELGRRDVTGAGSMRIHQYHRLILLLESDAPLVSLAEAVKRARRTAARQFEKVRVGTMTLGEYLISLADRPTGALDFVIGEQNVDWAKHWSKVLGEEPKAVLHADPEFASRVGRAFLLSFLSSIARGRKHAKPE